MSCSECLRDDAIICSMLCRSTRGARTRPARTGFSIAQPRAARASELTDSVTAFGPSSMVPSEMAPSWAVAAAIAVIGSWAVLVPLAAVAAVLAINWKWAAIASPARS